LAKATGGVTASILFCQLFHWKSQLSNPNQWVRTTVDQIETETGLSRIEQELARSQLVKRSLLKERLASEHCETLEFWPDIDALEERLNAFWEEVSDVPCFNTRAENTSQQPSPSKFGLTNSPNDLYSEIKKEPLVEVLTPTQLEKQNPIGSEGCLASSDYISTTKRACATLDSSSTNSTVEVFEVSSGQPRRVKTDKFFPVHRQPLAVKVTPNYQFSGPWVSTEQFEEFQRALLDYAKNQGFERPSGWVFNIVDSITKGLMSPFWDEFVSGIPLGASQKVKRDWEIEPGIPYPAFEEERTQYYIHKGEPIEVALARARSDLRDPVLGKDLWEGFLRKCDRLADDAIKAKQLGVSTPYLPPSFRNRPPITKQSVMDKLSAVAPQFSLAASSSDSLSDQSLEQHKIEDEQPKSIGDVPTLSSLQEAYRTPMGRTLVERQIAEHPEWGYEIVDGQVIDSLPF
jgi:hypothetical protein